MRPCWERASSETVFPFLSGQVHHAATANEFGAQKGGVDRVEDRVSVRPVDYRMERCFQMNRIAAAFQSEVRRIGLAVYLNMLEHAAILTG